LTDYTFENNCLSFSFEIIEEPPIGTKLMLDGENFMWLNVVNSDFANLSSGGGGGMDNCQTINLEHLLDDTIETGGTQDDLESDGWVINNITMPEASTCGPFQVEGVGADNTSIVTDVITSEFPTLDLEGLDVTKLDICGNCCGETSITCEVYDGETTYTVTIPINNLNPTCEDIDEVVEEEVVEEDICEISLKDLELCQPLNTDLLQLKFSKMKRWDFGIVDDGITTDDMINISDTNNSLRFTSTQIAKIEGSNSTSSWSWKSKKINLGAPSQLKKWKKIRIRYSGEIPTLEIFTSNDGGDDSDTSCCGVIPLSKEMSDSDGKFVEFKFPKEFKTGRWVQIGLKGGETTKVYHIGIIYKQKRVK